MMTVSLESCAITDTAQIMFLFLCMVLGLFLLTGAVMLMGAFIFAIVNWIRGKAPSQVIRVVAFKEGDQWIAQCLEYDICAMADNLDTLQSRIETAIEAKLGLCRLAGRDPGSLPAAPERFFSLWEKRSGFDKAGSLDGVGYEMALCA